ncbi:MAG: type II toxin-antitoxin system RelE/ParE family toxin [Acidobacteriota bacterium]
MTVRVGLAKRAARQVREIDTWWRENRPAAADLFSEEFAAALAAIEGAPQLGQSVPHATAPDVRRVLLRATRHHVYYVFAGEVVRVLSVWSCLRGTGPDLRELN